MIAAHVPIVAGTRVYMVMITYPTALGTGPNSYRFRLVEYEVASVRNKQVNFTSTYHMPLDVVRAQFAATPAEAVEASAAHVDALAKAIRGMLDPQSDDNRPKDG